MRNHPSVFPSFSNDNLSVRFARRDAEKKREGGGKAIERGIGGRGGARGARRRGWWWYQKQGRPLSAPARAEMRNIMGHVFGRAALMTRFRRGSLDAALSPQTLSCRLHLLHLLHLRRFRRIVQSPVYVCVCLRSRANSSFLSTLHPPMRRSGE